MLGHVASMQNRGAAVRAGAIVDVFRALRIPPPSNLSRELSRLATRGHLVRYPNSTWAVTPEGEHTIRTLMANAPLDDLAVLTGGAPGEPSFGAVPHHLIPPQLAPAEFQSGIARFLDGHPRERNVFGMTRFPGTVERPLLEAIEACRGACSDAGFEFHLASDRTVADLLLGNVAAAMWSCNQGIALFEDRIGRGLNYNAVFEVGAMLVTGRRCLLFRDRTSPDLPTDLVGRIYTRVDFDDASSIYDAVSSWTRNTLGLIPSA